MWERAVKAAKSTWHELLQGPKSTRKKKGVVAAKPPLFKKEPEFFNDEDEKLSEVPVKKPAFKGTKQKLELTKTPAKVTVKQDDPIKDEPNFPQDVQESAEARVKKIADADMKKQQKKASDKLQKMQAPPMGKMQKHLLFMNVGDNSILGCIKAINSGTGKLPTWCRNFWKQLSVRKNKLVFTTNQGRSLPFALQEEKRDAVKNLYFNPREPSTIQPITDKLRGEWANISRKNVTRILRSLETYQRNFQRRKPGKVINTMSMHKPGTLACDMFFPSQKWGWHGKFACLSMMDTWSRYCWFYACVDKSKKTVMKAMLDFTRKFAALGHLPRRMLADKGTDLAPCKDIMEQYRLPRDGDQKLVFHSQTGQPVLIIEALNAQVQRRMQVFRTSKLTDDPSTILDDISEQLNNQKRPNRGNLTPLELLALNDQERKVVNSGYKRKEQVEVSGLKALKVGDTVRVLQMTRKEQLAPKSYQKGFAPKWTKEAYTVLKRTALRMNPGVFKYSIGLHTSYYRWELLKIPKWLDSEVPDGFVRHESHLFGDYDPESGSDYDPDDE
jgi:hypothetical protein